MSRVFVTGIRVHLTQLLRSSFDLIAMLVWPIIYASIAYYLLDAKNDPDLLLSASLGSAVMLIWSQVIVGSSFALEQQRMAGTLELLVAAPMPLAALLAPVLVASAMWGLYGLIVTLLWGWLLFGVPIAIEHPLAFAVAIPSCIVAIAMLGLIAAATFVLYRAAVFLGISLQYPVWIVTGLLVPFAVLPNWIGPVSWFLAPTWGFRAIRESALGGTPWGDIGMCAVVSLAYFAISIVCFQVFERLARGRATLRLS